MSGAFFLPTIGGACAQRNPFMAGGAGSRKARLSVGRSSTPVAVRHPCGSVVSDSITNGVNAMRTAAELRAEAEGLRTHPCNTLSFHAVNDRACNVWRMPKPTGDFSSDHAAGCNMALELIAATQSAERAGECNHAGQLLLLTAQRLTDVAQRMGFLDVLADALATGAAPDQLRQRLHAQWMRSFSSASPYGVN